jgi:hypothetical protein
MTAVFLTGLWLFLAFSLALSGERQKRRRELQREARSWLRIIQPARGHWRAP